MSGGHVSDAGKRRLLLSIANADIHLVRIANPHQQGANPHQRGRYYLTENAIFRHRLFVIIKYEKTINFIVLMMLPLAVNARSTEIDGIYLSVI